MARSKLLVIDAERTHAETLVEQLGSDRLDVTWSETADDGGKTAAMWSPDIIVIDVNLPDGNGFKLFTRLKREGKLDGAHFVITGRDVPEKTFADHRKLKRHADLYLHKPYSPDDLRAELARLLDDAPDASPSADGLLSEGLLDDEQPSAAPKKEEDYLDELDDLLGEVDDGGMEVADKAADSELEELDRLLGGEPDTAVDTQSAVASPDGSDGPPPLDDLPQTEPDDDPADEPALEEDSLEELDELDELDELPVEDDLLADDDLPTEDALPIEDELPAEDDLLADDDLAAEDDLPIEDELVAEDALSAEDALPVDDEPDAPEFDIPAEAGDALEAVVSDDDAELDDLLEDVGPSEAATPPQLDEQPPAEPPAQLDAAFDDEAELALAEELEAYGEDEASDPIAGVRESEVAALIDKLEQTRRERDALARQLAEQPAAPAQDDNLDERIKKAQDVARIKADEATELAQTLKARDAELSEASEELERIKTKLRGYAEEIGAKYEQNIEQAKQKIIELTDALGLLRDKQMGEHEDLKVRIQRLEAEVTGANERAQSLADTLEAERSNHAATLEALRNEHDEKLETINADQSHLAEKIDNYKGRINDLQTKLNEQHDAHQLDLDALKQAQEDAVAAERERLNERMEKQAAEFNQQLETMRSKLAQTDDSLQHEREARQQAESERDGLRTELSAAQSSGADNAGQLDALKTDLAELKQKLVAANAELSEAQKQVKESGQLQKQLAELEARNQRNEQRVIDAFTKLKSDMEVRARIEKALVLTLKLLKSPLEPAAPAKPANETDPGQNG